MCKIYDNNNDDIGQIFIKKWGFQKQCHSLVLASVLSYSQINQLEKRKSKTPRNLIYKNTFISYGNRNLWNDSLKLTDISQC